MGCVGSSAEKKLAREEKELELAQKRLDLERQRLELDKQKQGLTDGAAFQAQPSNGQNSNAGQPAPEASSGSYLTVTSISQGMAVKVTDSKERLKESCASTGLGCSEDRVLLLGEAGFVTAIDTRDSTAHIEWPGIGKKGFMPIACLVRTDSVPGAPTQQDSSGLEQGLLAMLLAAAVGGGAAGDASDAPHKRLVPGQGVHLHSDLKSIKVDETKTKAVCVVSTPATVFTEEVLTPSDCFDFTVKVGTASKPICVGITDRVPTGYSQLLLGDSKFQGTIGALFTSKGGMVTHRQPVDQAPAIADGDLLCVRARRGTVNFLKNGVAFFEFRVSGEYRFAVSMPEEGQSATLVFTGQPTDVVLAMGELKTGKRVRLPSSDDERLQTMRVKWNQNMLVHCSAVGEVLEVRERCAVVSVNGKKYLWDLELFDSKQKRFSPNGGELKSQKATQPMLCNVTKAWIPVGSEIMRCAEHDYTVCEYACGKPCLPEVGCKVVRGPTWKWADQDVKPYEEGTVRSMPDLEGWFLVEWGDGSKGSYRGPPFQDVLPARSNGLKGKEPQGDGEGGEEKLGELLTALQAALAAGVGDDAKHLARASFKEGEGWHFYQGLKSISVDDTQKVAVCKESRDATVVTDEVFDTSGDYSFAVKVCNAAGSATSEDKPVTIGVVDDNPKGFSTNIIGQSNFKKCIGAMCLANGAGGAMVHEGSIVGEAPGVNDGDVLSVRVQNGQCDWAINGLKFHSCQVKGKFRFGVSLVQQGQSVELVTEGSFCGPSSAAVQSSILMKMERDVQVVTWGTQLKVDEKDKSQRLGVGGFGETWKAKLVTPTGDQPVAVKLLKKDKLTPELRKDFALEVKALASLTLPGGVPHPHLLRLVAIVPEKYAIVTELCISDLAAYLKKKEKPSSTVHVSLMQQVAAGMAWLADRQYVHRDLKMQNILIAEGDQAKVADFGLARPTAETSGEVAGTLLFMAPECFNGHFSQKSDVYSFAYIMFGTFSGEEVDVRAFLDAKRLLKGLRGDLQPVLVEAIKKGERPDMHKSIPDWVATVIKASWQQDPTKRPTFESISADFRQRQRQALQGV